MTSMPDKHNTDKHDFHHALMEVDNALDDSHGHRCDRRRQQRAILVDVKEV
jgi:hypothetical protein